MKKNLNEKSKSLLTFSYENAINLLYLAESYYGEDQETFATVDEEDS